MNMSRRPHLSTRTLLLLVLLATILPPVIYFAVPMIAAYLLPKEADIAFPDLEQLNAQFEANRRDREERVRRLLDNVDSGDDAMRRLANHDFVGADDHYPSRRWLMTTETGQQFCRSTLRQQSQLFDCLGRSAVPDLLKWLAHDQMEIRYIASYALQRITGLNSRLPTFATLDELNEQGWLAKARAEYEDWLSLTSEAESPNKPGKDHRR